MAQSMTEQSADEFRRLIEIVGNFLDNPDQIALQQIIIRIFRHVPLSQLLQTIIDPDRKILTNRLDFIILNRYRGRIGVGVHPVSSGQNPFKDRCSIGERFSSFKRHSIKRQPTAFLNRIQCGGHIRLRAAENDLSVSGLSLEQFPYFHPISVAKNRQFEFRAQSAIFKCLRMGQIRPLQTCDDFQSIA